MMDMAGMTPVLLVLLSVHPGQISSGLLDNWTINLVHLELDEILVNKRPTYLFEHNR